MISLLAAPRPHGSVPARVSACRRNRTTSMNRIASRRPSRTEFTSDYHEGLIEQVQGDCVLHALDRQLFWLCELASHLSTEQIDKIHPPYGWTVRQVFEHCADAERVFGYRMLRLAAGDSTPLPGWSENDYADARFGLGTFSGLVSEMGQLRQANVNLLRRILPQAWDRAAEVDGGRINVRAIAWVAAGHLQHHLRIVEKRCGISLPCSDGSSESTSHDAAGPAAT